MRPRCILAPTDFSAYSDLAIRYAASLAGRYKARLCLLHVISDDGLRALSRAHLPPHPVDKVYEDLEVEVREQYRKQVPAALRHLVAAEVLVVPGTAFVEIIRSARQKGADLIVMGTHGRSGVAHALLGSVTEKVVRKAPCPVLSIRPPEGEA